EQVDAVTSSGAFGALGAALRRAEARGIALEEDLPFVIKRADTGAEDLAAVLHERVDRWTDASPPPTNRATSADCLILGFLPAAITDDATMAAALTERARLMESRADLLVQRARAASAPWLKHLEEEVNTATDPVLRSSAARMVAAYRERHQV